MFWQITKNLISSTFVPTWRNAGFIIPYFPLTAPKDTGDKHEWYWITFKMMLNLIISCSIYNNQNSEWFVIKEEFSSKSFTILWVLFFYQEVDCQGNKHYLTSWNWLIIFLERWILKFTYLKTWFSTIFTLECLCRLQMISRLQKSMYNTF